MNALQRFLIAVSEDPVKYAMRVLICLAVFLFFALVVRNASPAEPFTVKCSEGICTIPQAQLITLLRLIRMPCGKVI